MKEESFNNYLEELIEKHVPTYFMDYEYLQKIIEAICFEHDMGRKEILMLAYAIGADVEETNKLLEMKGYSCLYVKRREDAIWVFAIRKRMDLDHVIKKIFLQDVD